MQAHELQTEEGRVITFDRDVEIVNAEIQSVRIGFDHDVFLTMWVFLDYGGSQQGFGGFVLGGAVERSHTGRGESERIPAARHQQQPNIAAEWIAQCLRAAGVDDVAAMRGRIVRVVREQGMGSVRGIGHATREHWWIPEASALLRDGKGRSQS